MKFSNILAITTIVAQISAIPVVAEEPTAPATVARNLLKEYGAVSYAHKPAYGSGISDMWLGYNAEGAAIAGVAARNTKTYAEAVALIAVTPKEGSYKVAAAEIPTIETFRGKSKDYTKDALKDITGRVFKDTQEARGLVDAVSGATKYYKAIYVSYALMASKVIEELNNAPDWPRTDIPAE